MTIIRQWISSSTDAELIDKDGKLLSENTFFDAFGMNDLKNAWDANLKFEIFNIGNRAAGCMVAFRINLKEYALPFVRNIDMLHDEQLAVAAIKKARQGQYIKVS